MIRILYRELEARRNNMASTNQSRKLDRQLGDSGTHYRDSGDLAIFGARTLGWMLRRRPSPGTLLASLYSVGVRSVPVVAITGMFIGMVLAVQAYEQFRPLGLTNRLGAIINVGVLRELGPVLAATMIAGRIGSALAAELGTMAVTDQIDALTCLGVPAIHFLVVPRVLACILLVPLLTVLADFMGVLGGALVSIRLYHVDAHFYWANTVEWSARGRVHGPDQVGVFRSALA